MLCERICDLQPYIWDRDQLLQMGEIKLNEAQYIQLNYLSNGGKELNEKGSLIFKGLIVL